LKKIIINVVEELRLKFAAKESMLAAGNNC